MSSDSRSCEGAKVRCVGGSRHVLGLIAVRDGQIPHWALSFRRAVGRDPGEQGPRSSCTRCSRRPTTAGPAATGLFNAVLAKVHDLGTAWARSIRRLGTTFSPARCLAATVANTHIEVIPSNQPQ